MNYSELISSCAASLGGLMKLAVDLAVILDTPALQITKDSWSGEHRRKVHEIFCALFLRSGLPLPDFEEELWRVDLPKEYGDFKEKKNTALKSATRIRDHVRGKSSSGARKIRALAETIQLFPDPNGGIKKETIIAMVNKILVEEMGAAPLRPDYEMVRIPTPLHNGASRPVRVVIVDDDTKEIFRTALKISGIPNVEIVVYHYTSNSRWDSLKGEKLEVRLSEVSKQIIDLRPDLVLMDQGLGDIEGDALVRSIRDLAQKSGHAAPIFVANSGGSGEELAKAGCWDNFSKGENPRAFISALNGL